MRKEVSPPVLQPGKESSPFLVLGCGSIGRRHIRNLLALKAGPIVAYDPLPERREEARAGLGIDAVESLEEAWARGPRAAFITASTQAHVPLAREAARRGCHLFIEKPLSHSREGLDRLAEEVDRRELVTLVGCNLRFHPGPARVKKLLEEGAVGEIISARLHTGSHLPGWRAWQDYRESYSASPEWGGAILDCIHEIDLALWYLGPARVLAAAHRPARSIGLETDGLAEILLGHEKGALTSIHVNFVQRDYCRTCQIIGTRGTLSWDFNRRTVLLHGEDGEVRERFPEPEGWELNRMYVDELNHFLGALRNGGPSVNPLAGGRAALEVALAARQMGAVGGLA